MLDLYFIIILVSAENAFSHKYVVARGSSILTIFWDNDGYSRAMLSQNLGCGCYLNWIFISVCYKLQKGICGSIANQIEIF